MPSQHRSREILTAFQRNGVPLSMAVPFLLRLDGWAIGETADAAGYTRAYLHLLLQRGLAPPDGLREAVTGRLGIDPWQVYATADNKGKRHEL